MKILRPGETAIRATFLGQVTVVMVTAPHERAIDPGFFTLKNNFIDEHVFKKLAALHIEPSDLCGDEVFIRAEVLVPATQLLPALLPALGH